MNAARRRKTAKGKWMRLRDAGLLVEYMKLKKMSQSSLARHAECSRQFIHMLINGERPSCTPAVGSRIEEALGVLPQTLFLPKKATTVDVKRKKRVQKRVSKTVKSSAA